jgi:AcrR family transcriptional regulator
MKDDPASTQARVLDAASTLFAAKGFRGTTVADICRHAGANIAAVNYYFGSKKKLYREAWRHAHVSMLKAFPPDGAVPAGAAAELRLRGRLRGLLQRAMAGDGREFRIMSHEMTNPTGLLAQVVQDSLGPLRQAMREILGELLGNRADEQVIQWCQLCVVGPCLQLVRRRHMHRPAPSAMAAEAASASPADGELEEMVDHFTSFALAGIRDIRRQLEAGQAVQAVQTVKPAGAGYVKQCRGKP